MSLESLYRINLQTEPRYVWSISELAHNQEDLRHIKSVVIYKQAVSIYPDHLMFTKLNV
jgi:hypothetical protein